MDRKQLLDFQKNTMLECNEIFHYLTYLMEAYTSIMAVFVMANIENFLLYALFAVSAFLTIQCWNRKYIWVRDEGQRIRIIYYMRYLPVNWREYFKIRSKMLIQFFYKTAALIAVMGMMGYYLFHRTLNLYMLWEIGKEFFCITVIFLGIGFFEIKQERKSCHFGPYGSRSSFLSNLF